MCHRQKWKNAPAQQADEVSAIFPQGAVARRGTARRQGLFIFVRRASICSRWWFIVLPLLLLLLCLGE